MKIRRAMRKLACLSNWLARYVIEFAKDPFTPPGSDRRRRSKAAAMGVCILGKIKPETDDAL